VLLASFDEGVVLSAPQTLDRERIATAIERVEVGERTALWESLRDLMRYLAALPGEKVMLVLTDGADSVGAGLEALRQVEALARAEPQVVLFVGAIDMPRTDPAARARLTRVARSTGGDLLVVSASGPGSVVEPIRRDLDARRFLAYEPPAGVDPGGEIRIRVRPGRPCRVHPIGDPARLASDTPPEAAIERRPIPPGLVVPACGIEGGRDAADAVGYAGGATFVRLAEPWSALVDLDDVVLEPGPRFREPALHDPARLVPASAARRRVEHRTVVVDLPPLDRLRSTRHDAVDVLRDVLLDDRFCIGGPEGGRAPPRPAFVVHGQTFLEARELLGRGLFEARADYRAWSTERAASRAEEQVRLQLEPPPLAPQVLEAAVRAARERAADPRIGRPQAWLAAWLGDTAAVDAVRELERRLATDLLGGTGEAERAVVAWPRLARLLPPAVRGRTITPLLPAYDPARDAVGFHRFLLPAPRPDGARPVVVAPRALGLELLLWLRARDELGRVASQGARVVAIDYPQGRDAAPGSSCGVDSDGAGRVVVRLAAPGAAGRSLDLVASFGAGEGAPPSCFTVNAASMRKASG
jgi:hypothetical protein